MVPHSKVYNSVNIILGQYSPLHNLVNEDLNLSDSRRNSGEDNRFIIGTWFNENNVIGSWGARSLLYNVMKIVFKRYK